MLELIIQAVNAAGAGIKIENLDVTIVIPKDLSRSEVCELGVEIGKAIADDNYPGSNFTIQRAFMDNLNVIIKATLESPRW